MGVYELYSKRQKRARDQGADVFTYDELPDPLRVQILLLFDDVLGQPRRHDVEMAYDAIRSILHREYGEPSLAPGAVRAAEKVHAFFKTTRVIDRALDVVELVFRGAHRLREDPLYEIKAGITGSLDDAVRELNVRFREHGVGYQFEPPDIVRVDSTLLHAQVAKPALVLLADPQYRGADEEFRKAYEHYRRGDHKEAINEALKAFESTMKIICAKRGWSYEEKDTAQKLIDRCFSNGLLSAELQSEFSALRASLESGIPTVRNRKGGHGQGTRVVEVPAHLAGYLLHMTAATILFLVQSEQELA